MSTQYLWTVRQQSQTCNYHDIVVTGNGSIIKVIHEVREITCVSDGKLSLPKKMSQLFTGLDFNQFKVGWILCMGLLSINSL